MHLTVNSVKIQMNLKNSHLQLSCQNRIAMILVINSTEVSINFFLLLLYTVNYGQVM